MAGRERSEAAALAVGLVAGVWRWRLELALLALVLGVERLLAGPLGDLAATGVVATLAAGAVLAAPTRRLLWAAVRRAWLRRAWERDARADRGRAARAGAARPVGRLARRARR
jgi:hypothetical protein